VSILYSLLSLSLTQPHTLSLALFLFSFSLALSLALSFSLSVSLSVSFSLFLALSLSLTVSHLLTQSTFTGLLSNFFDGLQRPLAVNTEQDFIPSNGPIGLDKDRQWPFEPNRRFGVGDVVTGGDLIGTVKENSIIIHRIMVPPGDEGIINFIADTGNFTLKVTQPPLHPKVSLTHHPICACV